MISFDLISIYKLIINLSKLSYVKLTAQLMNTMREAANRQRNIFSYECPLFFSFADFKRYKTITTSNRTENTFFLLILMIFSHK